MNWKDQRRQDRFVFEQIDPNNLDVVRGELEGVILSSSSLTEGYETDTRISGKLAVYGANYIENSMIRIHHFVDEKNYHCVLGTFFVTSDNLEYAQGVWQGSLDLKSSLYGLKEENWTQHYAIASGQSTHQALSQLLTTCHRSFIIEPSVSHSIYASSVVYEFGDNCLDTLFSLCEKANARAEVDGYGRIVIAPYAAPRSLSSVFELGYDARDSMITSSIKRSTNRSDIPGSIGVIAKDGKTEITASVEASPLSFASPARRGYRKVAIHKPSDLFPKTTQGAQAYAREKLLETSLEAVEYSFDTLYIPYGQGYALDLIIEGVREKCLIKTKDVSFAPGMPCKLVVKAV